MSFFFNKSDSQDKLQYDDTAFLHFAISICVTTNLVVAFLIKRDIASRKRPNIDQVKSLPHFGSKLAKSMKRQPKYFTTSDFLVKLVVILVCLAAGVLAYSNISEDSAMIGFDPYEIMGVEHNAPLMKIKKAYRKLALEFHPDRNSNNPQAAAKFIQISKAYECLTDPEAKQKCEKYGNPDGQISFKVGIGLPHFMIDAKNQYYVLPPIFIILLFIVPRYFMKFMRRQKPVDSNGNLLANYPMFYSLITPRINPITCAVIMGCMKELDPIFPKDKVLDEAFEKGFKEILIKSQALTEQQLAEMSQHTLFRCAAVYGYLAGRQNNEELARHIPQLTLKMIFFALFFSQKSLEGQMLMGNPNWVIRWYGMEPVRVIVYFARQMFNPLIRIGDPKSIQFLDLTADDMKVCQENPLGNLQMRLLGSDFAIDEYIKLFSKERREYIKKQVLCLPTLKLETRVLLGDEEVREMTFEDFATFEIKVTRKRQTPGYILCKGYPFLDEETFILMVSYNSNMMLCLPLVFPPGKNEVVLKLPHRQAVERQMKFNVNVVSLNYPSMDIEGSINVDVLAPTKETKIQIHKEDLNIDKIPKNFFESLASMETVNESDRELSDSDQEEQTQPIKNKEQEKKRARFQEEETYEKEA